MRYMDFVEDAEFWLCENCARTITQSERDSMEERILKEWNEHVAQIEEHGRKLMAGEIE